MNRQFQNYNILTDLVSNSDDFKVLIDNANSKYNNALWRSFTTVLPATISKKFSAIVEETGIAVKASVVGSMGKKPLISTEGGTTYSDSIHKIGLGFKVDQSDMNNIEEMNYVNTNLATEMLKVWDVRATTVFQGFNAMWNDWAFYGLSNQEIPIYNQGVLDFTVDLRTPASNKLKAKGSAGWFTSGTTAKIADDLVRMDKRADDTGMPSLRMFCISKTTADKLILDTNLNTAVKASLGFYDTTNAIISRTRFLSILSQLLEIPPIVVIDEKSRINVDGVPQLDSKAFNDDKVVLVPQTAIFDMHNSPSDYTKDTNPAALKTFTEGGLIGAIQLYESDPIQIITNMESWSFLTFKNPKWIVSLDHTAHSATGA